MWNLSSTLSLSVSLLCFYYYYQFRLNCILNSVVIFTFSTLQVTLCTTVRLTHTKTTMDNPISLTFSAPYWPFTAHHKNSTLSTIPQRSQVYPCVNALTPFYLKYTSHQNLFQILLCLSFLIFAPTSTPKPWRTDRLHHPVLPQHVSPDNGTSIIILSYLIFGDSLPIPTVSFYVCIKRQNTVYCTAHNGLSIYVTELNKQATFLPMSNKYFNAFCISMSAYLLQAPTEWEISL